MAFEVRLGDDVDDARDGVGAVDRAARAGQERQPASMIVGAEHRKVDLRARGVARDEERVRGGDDAASLTRVSVRCVPRSRMSGNAKESPFWPCVPRLLTPMPTSGRSSIRSIAFTIWRFSTSSCPITETGFGLSNASAGGVGR